MGLEMIFNRLENLDEETYAQSFIRYTKMELDDVKRSFIKIGFRLNEAVKYEYYKELGYKDIVELAEAEFGFGKSTTYGMMKLNKLFCLEDNPMYVAEKYEGYSYTQLLVLSSVKYDGSAFWNIVRPSDSVSKLKKFVSNWNKEYKTGCGWHYGLKTVDDYLKYAEEKEEKQHDQEIKRLLIVSDSVDSNDGFSNRLENVEDGSILESEAAAMVGEDNKFGATNIEYIRVAPIANVANMIAKCVCNLPEDFGCGMPYEDRLSQWLQIWLLSK